MINAEYPFSNDLSALRFLFVKFESMLVTLCVHETPGIMLWEVLFVKHVLVEGRVALKLVDPIECLVNMKVARFTMVIPLYCQLIES